MITEKFIENNLFLKEFFKMFKKSNWQEISGQLLIISIHLSFNFHNQIK